MKSRPAPQLARSALSWSPKTGWSVVAYALIYQGNGKATSGRSNQQMFLARSAFSGLHPEWDACGPKCIPPERIALQPNKPKNNHPRIPPFMFHYRVLG